jgi:predicted transcriptional regulator YdeE
MILIYHLRSWNSPHMVGHVLASTPSKKWIIPGKCRSFRYTVNAIWSQWLPESGHKAARAATGAPDFFERYLEGFDPQLGMGDVEVWITVIK